MESRTNSVSAKKPIDDGWPSRIIDAASAPLYFNGGPQNIGVVLGPSSRGLTDVDLDAPEAVTIAPYFLPPTKAIFGRASKPSSHWLYITNLSTTETKAAIKLKMPGQKGATLLELRIGGNSGAQTVFPGSTHKDTGELITWEINGEPAVVDGADLFMRVKRVAAACLIARNWPAPGSRHDTALALGGFLSRCGLAETEIKLIVEASSRAAADPEWRDRVQAAKDAARAHIGGKPAAGFPALSEFINEAAITKIANWLDVSAFFQPAQSTPQPAQSTTAVTGGSSWPQIRIIPGEIPRIVNEAEEALLSLGCEIYQRGGLVVRPVLTTFKAGKKREVQGWRLVPVSRPYLVDTLTCAAHSGNSTDAPKPGAQPTHRTRSPRSIWHDKGGGNCRC